MSEPTVTFGGQCLFCGQEIEPVDPEPIEVMATTTTGKWQMWWAHGACFKAEITDPPGADGFFAPAHF